VPSPGVTDPDNDISEAGLLALIEAAFPLLPLPEMSLHQAQLADQSMTREISDDEWERTGDLDAGRSWKDFSDDELLVCDAALSHFDEPSFAYYLPAYLIFALRHFAAEWKEPAWHVVHSAVFSVTHRTAYALSRFKKLSPEQREAIVGFLKFFASHRTDGIGSDAEKALTRYWLTKEAAEPLIIIAGTSRRREPQ
jgi:Family of unknown function (DUF6714)